MFYNHRSKYGLEFYSSKAKIAVEKVYTVQPFEGALELWFVQRCT